MFIFDTSSFISLVRYYLPFDNNQKIYKHFKRSLVNGRIILIDAVLDECRYVSKKIVIEKLDFLNDKTFLKANHLPVKTHDLVPAAPRKFYNLVDNNFTTPIIKRLTNIEFEQRKKDYLKSADAKLILYAYNIHHDNPDKELAIVTEETTEANDNKAFKKIPVICTQLGVQSINLPEYLAACDDLDMTLG